MGKRAKRTKGGKEKNTLTTKLERELGLMKRHVEVLKAIMDNKRIGIIKLSEIMKYPQHKVRYSLRILEETGLIEPTSTGAKTTDKLPEFLDRLKEVLDDMGESVDRLRKKMD